LQYLASGQLNTKMELLIINSLGIVLTKRMIDDAIAKEVSIDVSQWPTGVYYCLLKDENELSEAISMVKK
jgi:hypothetical protein